VSPSPGDQQWQQRSHCIDCTNRIRLEYTPRGVSRFTTVPRKRIDATYSGVGDQQINGLLAIAAHYDFRDRWSIRNIGDVDIGFGPE
jgi:hypothetical protein